MTLNGSDWNGWVLCCDGHNIILINIMQYLQLKTSAS